MACETNCNCSNCASDFLFPVGPKGDVGKGIAGPVAITATGDPNTNGTIGEQDGQGYTDAATGIQYTWNESTKSWDVVTDGSGNPILSTGPAGASAFVYIAYATDNIGAGFSLTDPVGKDYLGVISTNVELTPPIASNFAGKWQLVKGENGASTLPVGFVGFYFGDTRPVGSGTPASKGGLGDNIAGSLGIKDLLGWALCDGSVFSGYTTPDCLNKFILSTDSPSEINNIGGQDSVTLNANNIPAHTHPASLSATATSGGAASVELAINWFDAGSILNSAGRDSSGDLTEAANQGGTLFHVNLPNHTHPVTGTVTVSPNVTTGASFDNRPAFIKGAAIVKLPS